VLEAIDAFAERQCMKRKDELFDARTVRFYEVGDPEVLKIDEVPSRRSGRREVTLRVQAVGLNRAGSMFRHRHYLEATKLAATLGYKRQVS
jgi:NADPH:quinone reductase-like Zn-dependent oxidoreductase